MASLMHLKSLLKKRMKKFKKYDYQQTEILNGAEIVSDKALKYSLKKYLAIVGIEILSAAKQFTANKKNKFSASAAHKVLYRCAF